MRTTLDILPERLFPLFSRVNSMSFERTLSTMNVYFVSAKFGASTLVKIGMAKNLRFRLQSMQVGCPAQLHPIAQIKCENLAAAREVERYAHELFKANNVRGEWFSMPDDWGASMPKMIAKASEFGRAEFEDLSGKKHLYDGSLLTRKNCTAGNHRHMPPPFTVKKYCTACKVHRPQLGGKVINSTRGQKFTCANCVAVQRELESLAQ